MSEKAYKKITSCNKWQKLELDSETELKVFKCKATCLVFFC